VRPVETQNFASLLKTLHEEENHQISLFPYSTPAPALPPSRPPPLIPPTAGFDEDDDETGVDDLTEDDEELLLDWLPPPVETEDELLDNRMIERDDEDELLGRTRGILDETEEELLDDLSVPLPSGPPSQRERRSRMMMTMSPRMTTR